MIKIILASHGQLAEGLKMTLEMIVGNQPEVDVISFMPNQNPEFVYNRAKELCKDKEEVLFFVDLWGGTPFNQLCKLVQEQESYRILTGMNLPMVLEACMVKESMHSAQALMEHIVSVVNQSVQPFPQVDKKEIVQSKVEKGYMHFVFARIDSRLLHGQVATGWTKAYNPDRIFVVSDTVSHDAVRKKMIIQASPAGVKAHVIPLKKLVELSKDDRFGNMKVLLLFENIEDALKIVKAGVSLPSINLGSIAHAQGKVVVNTAISMDEKDVKDLEELKQYAEIDVRKVPADVKENVDVLISKAKSILKEER